MMTATRKSKIANVVLWAAYLLALAASMGHVAWAFGTLEFAGSEWVGWLAALAVDAGLAALAYGVQQRKRARRTARDLWAGVLLFAGISAFANVLHALTALTGSAVTLATFGAVDALAFAKAVTLSASLPLLVVYLGEIVSSDDAQAASDAERERQRAERLARQSDASLPKLAPEGDVLTQANATRKTQAEQAVSNLLAFYGANPGATQGQAAQAVARSRQWVSATLAQLETAGHIRRNGAGVEVAGAANG
jgi:hypothetical protein